MNSDRSKVRRLPARGSYESETIHAILDEGFVAHIGFQVDGQPFVIPTLYGRDGDRLFLHGSAASRMMRQLETGVPACVTVTHVDGLVLARSAFHHSMNYRSVVAFGTARKVEEHNKVEALRVISDHLIKGRWEDVREPNEKELRRPRSSSSRSKKLPQRFEPADLSMMKKTTVGPFGPESCRLRFQREFHCRTLNSIPKPAYPPTFGITSRRHGIESDYS